ncbi:hypothetical protein Hypma_007042 [Hypsizygus marmoreus]|uniref:Uncharacterized protein n=1 Tax=Hypsizygus marmoreus TaxID=39966 RepID=A0A369KEY1_HYPMA|nr:hypothetical protein Hypma_007042 [Hypsizygus marmoreus]
MPPFCHYLAPTTSPDSFLLSIRAYSPSRSPHLLLHPYTSFRESNSAYTNSDFGSRNPRIPAIVLLLQLHLRHVRTKAGASNGRRHTPHRRMLPVLVPRHVLYFNFIGDGHSLGVLHSRARLT